MSETPKIPPPPKKPPPPTRPPTKPPRRTSVLPPLPDDLMALADAVQSPVTFTGEPPSTPIVAADSEGCAGADPTPARFTLPPILTVPSFDNGPGWAP